jgi:hypothetical protein
MIGKEQYFRITEKGTQLLLQKDLRERLRSSGMVDENGKAANLEKGTREAIEAYLKKPLDAPFGSKADAELFKKAVEQNDAVLKNKMAAFGSVSGLMALDGKFRDAVCNKSDGRLRSAEQAASIISRLAEAKTGALADRFWAGEGRPDYAKIKQEAEAAQKQQ